MRSILLGLVGSLGLLVGGCSAESGRSAGGSDDPLTQVQSPIFHGQPDTTHQAVVALYKQSGNAGELCTGTIIAVSGAKGFVLTAAHCIADGKPDVVLMGNDIDAQNIKQFAVSDAKAHPSYSQEGGPYDFAMVTITGVSASTPVIAPMTKETDSLKAGSAVTFVGYGRTESNDNNSVRNKVSGTLSSLSSIQVNYSQASGGPCNGDSGGPSLSTVNGVELVSSVTSYGDQDCTVTGTSGRVSAVYDSFIKPYIDGTSATLTCDECSSASTGSDGACASAVSACQNDTACAKLAQCLSACSDATCQQTCAKNSTSAAVSKYTAVNTCVCKTGCTTECATECQGGSSSSCGYDFTQIGADCGTCADASCCDAQSACVDDDTCNTCVTTQGATGCDKNTAYNTLISCISGSCKTQCGGSSTGCAYDFSQIGADCGTCADASCCDKQKTCAADTTCNTCVTTQGATGCDKNAAYVAMVTCLQDSCGTECGFDSGAAGTDGGAGTDSGTAGSGISTAGSSSSSTGGKSSGTGGKAGSGATSSAGGTSSGGLFGGSAGTSNSSAGGTSDDSAGGTTGTAGVNSSSGCSAAPTPASSSPLAALALGLAAVVARRRRQG